MFFIVGQKAKCASMAFHVIVHVIDDEPFRAEIEELPEPTATCVRFKNPTTRDDNKVKWTTGAVQSVIFSMSRITFIEIPIIPGQVEGHVNRS